MDQPVPFDYGATPIKVQRAADTETPESGRPGAAKQLGRLHLRLRALEMTFGHVPPFVGGRLRTMAMRAAGLRIGQKSLFFGLPTLVGPEPLQDRFSVGAHCGFNAGSFFDLEDSVSIGDHVAVGHDVMFLTSRPGSDAGGAANHAPIVVEDGVWLGARSIVFPGVTIGKSSVIGAGVVVTEDVPANTLFAGATKVSIARWR